MSFIPNLSFLSKAKSATTGICVVFSMMSVVNIALILNKNSFSDAVFLVVFVVTICTSIGFCTFLALLGLATQRKDSVDKFEMHTLEMTREQNKTVENHRGTQSQ